MPHRYRLSDLERACLLGDRAAFLAAFAGGGPSAYEENLSKVENEVGETLHSLAIRGGNDHLVRMIEARLAEDRLEDGPSVEVVKPVTASMALFKTIFDGGFESPNDEPAYEDQSGTSALSSFEQRGVACKALRLFSAASIDYVRLRRVLLVKGDVKTTGIVLDAEDADRVCVQTRAWQPAQAGSDSCGVVRCYSVEPAEALSTLSASVGDYVCVISEEESKERDWNVFSEDFNKSRVKHKEMGIVMAFTQESGCYTVMIGNGSAINAKHVRLLPLQTKAVCDEIIIPLTRRTSLSVVQHLSLSPDEEAVGRASVFCSHAWSYPFHEFIAACLVGAASTQFFWIDIFCVKQNVVTTSHLPEDYFYNVFRQGIQEIGHLLVILNPYHDAICFKRSWCLWELFCAADCSTARIDFALFPDEQSKLSSTSSIVKMKPDVASAQAFKQSDREAILEAIDASIGCEALNLLCVDTFADAQIDQEFASVASSGKTFIQLSMLSFSTRGAMKFEQNLASGRFSSVTKVGLNGAHFNTFDSRRIMAGALGSTRLEKICFFGNSAALEHVLPLALLARTGLRYLKELVVIDGSVIDSDLKALATFVLSSNASPLQFLDLKSNPLISDEGVTVLARALSSNSVLTSLTLDGCALIGDAGASKLGFALRSNQSLTSVGLSDCPSIGDSGITALVDVLHANRTVTSLDLKLPQAWDNVRGNHAKPENCAKPETLAALRKLNDAAVESARCPGRAEWSNDSQRKLTDYDLVQHTGRH